jgi:hypothetical protein
VFTLKAGSWGLAQDIPSRNRETAGGKKTQSVRLPATDGPTR